MKKHCTDCGKEFDKRGDAKFCSMECKNRHSYKLRIGELHETPQKIVSVPTEKDIPVTPGRDLTQTIEKEPEPEKNKSVAKAPKNIDALFFSELISENIITVGKSDEPEATQENDQKRKIKDSEDKGAIGNL